MRGWPDSNGDIVDLVITPEMLAKAQQCEPDIRKHMATVAEAKRMAGIKLAQANALPNTDVRTQNQGQDRAASAFKRVPVVDLEGTDVLCSVCDKNR